MFLLFGNSLPLTEMPKPLAPKGDPPNAEPLLEAGVMTKTVTAFRALSHGTWWVDGYDVEDAYGKQYFTNALWAWGTRSEFGDAKTGTIVALLTAGLFDDSFEISSVTPVCTDQRPVDQITSGTETYPFARVNIIQKSFWTTANADYTVEYYGCDGSRTLMWTLVNNRPNILANSIFSLTEPSSSLPVGTITDISSLWRTGFDGLITKNEDMALAAMITVLMAKVAMAPFVVLFSVLYFLGDFFKDS